MKIEFLITQNKIIMNQIWSKTHHLLLAITLKKWQKKSLKSLKLLKKFSQCYKVSPILKMMQAILLN